MKSYKQFTEDAALDFVKKKIEREHGKGAYVSKDNPRKPQTPEEKARYVLIKQKLMQKMQQNVRKIHHRAVTLKDNASCI